jgi:hypothetical protein
MTNYDVPRHPTDALHDRPGGLEFPDWSGMAEHRVGFPLADALRWNDEMRRLFPPRPHWAEDSAAAKCTVEFVL